MCFFYTGVGPKLAPQRRRWDRIRFLPQDWTNTSNNSYLALFTQVGGFNRQVWRLTKIASWGAALPPPPLRKGIPFSRMLCDAFRWSPNSPHPTPSPFLAEIWDSNCFPLITKETKPMSLWSNWVWINQIFPVADGSALEFLLLSKVLK